jgi:hypothetical protein
MGDPMESLYLTQLHAEARRNSGWIKFLGIVLIIVGIPTAILLVGLLYIWLGMMLVQAANAVEREGEAGLLQFVGKLGLYFKVYAILTIIGLILSAVMIGVALFGVLSGFENGGIFT